MSQTVSDNKRIAKNTMMLYLRMGASMFVAFFTSRVVLNTLGVENFGIYNIAGGVVALLGFLNSSLTAATSRFITVEMGKKNNSNLNCIFNCAFFIHLFLAFIIVILLETIGIWFFENKLVIPAERMNAAMWVYQLSILSTIIGITQVPYSSCIVAHERLDIYAYVDMTNIFLRLLIVYLLVIGDFDKLILYSILTTLLSIGTALFYRYFCHKHFNECHLKINLDKNTIKEMLSFSGWDLFGNISVTIRGQGTAMIINIFYGVVANAACGIAGQVQGIVMGFASNILMAIRPQITKSYACKDFNRCFELIQNSTIAITYLLAILTIPIILEINYILRIWLKIVPEYSSSFCILTLIFNYFSALAMLTLTIPHAEGKNKWPSLINGIIYTTTLPVSYIFYLHFDIVWFPYLYNVFAMIMGFIAICFISKRFSPSFPMKNILLTITKCITYIFITFVFLKFIQNMIPNESLYRLLIIFFTSLALISLTFLYGGIISSRMRTVIYKSISEKIRINKSKHEK